MSTLKCIKHTDWHGSQLLSLEEAVELATRAKYAEGSVERLQEQIDNMRGLLTRLIEHSRLGKYVADVLGPEFDVKG